MTRIGSVLTLAGLALTGPLASQTQSAVAPATVVILARTLTLTNRQGLDFGSHFASDGKIRSDNTNAAVWDGEIASGTKINVTFPALPTELTRDGGGDAVPISYGTTSGRVDYFVGMDSFNPAAMAGYSVTVSGSDFFHVYLGLIQDVHPETDAVTVDLTGKPAGTYRATITLTVAVL